MLSKLRGLVLGLSEACTASAVAPSKGSGSATASATAPSKAARSTVEARAAVAASEAPSVFAVSVSSALAAASCALSGRSLGRIAASSDRVRPLRRSEEHTSELQSLRRISYAVFCLKKKKNKTKKNSTLINSKKKKKQKT